MQLRRSIQVATLATALSLSFPTFTHAADIAQVININTADVSTLMQLKGVGESLADSIVNFRNDNGDFISIEQLDEVRGISDKRIKQWSDQITV